MQTQDSFTTFSKFFKVPVNHLYIAYANPAYFQTEIPKKNGEVRIVYAPSKLLKSVQRKIASRLSRKYLDVLPKQVMGFVKVKEWQQKRDIVSNARKHLSKDYLINVDIKSFFGSITTRHVEYSLLRLYTESCFDMNILMKLVTLNGSLPPGAPTSPVLSNIVFVELDRQIQSYCKKNNLYYTRYADDLSFSSEDKISKAHIEYVNEVLNTYNFHLNAEKTRFFGKGEEKTVTGVGIRKGKLVLCKESKEEILANIKYYHQWKKQALSGRSPGQDELKRLKDMQRSLKGQLNFAKRIEGERGKNYHDLMIAYERSLDEKEFGTRLYI